MPTMTKWRLGFLFLSFFCVVWSLKTLWPPTVDSAYQMMFNIGAVFYFVYLGILIYDKLIMKKGE